MGGSCISRPKRIRKRNVGQAGNKSEDVMNEKVNGESERSESQLCYPFFEPAWNSKQLQRRQLSYLDILQKGGALDNKNSFVKNFVAHRFYLYSSIDAAKAFQQISNSNEIKKGVQKIDESFVWSISSLEATLFGSGEKYRFQCHNDNQMIVTNSMVKQVSQQTAFSLMGAQKIVHIFINDKKEIEMALAESGKQFTKMIDGFQNCRKINLDKNCMINGVLLIRDAGTKDREKEGSEMSKIIQFLHEKMVLRNCDEIFCYFNPFLSNRLLDLSIDGLNTYLQLKAYVQHPQINIIKLFDIRIILSDRATQLLCVYILLFCLKVSMASSSNTKRIPILFLKLLLNMEDDGENWLSRVIFVLKFMFRFCLVQQEKQKQKIDEMVDRCCRKILQLSLLNSHIIIDAYLIEFSIELDEKHLPIRQNPLLQIDQLIKSRMITVKKPSLGLVNQIKNFMKEIMPGIIDLIPSRKSLNTFSQICKIVEDRFNRWEDRALKIVKENVNQPYFNGITFFNELVKNQNFMYKSVTNDLILSSEFLFSLKIYLFVCKATHLVDLFGLKTGEKKKSVQNVTILKRLWEQIISDFMLNSIYAYCSGEMAVTVYTLDGLVKKLDPEGCEEQEAIFTKALEIWFRCNRDPRTKYQSWMNNYWGFYIIKILITTKTEAVPNFQTSQQFFSLCNLLECFSFNQKKLQSSNVNTLSWIFKNIPLNNISGIFYSKMELLSSVDQDQTSLLKTGSSFFDKSGENMSSKSGYSETQNKSKKCIKKRILNQTNIPEINCIRNGVYQWGKGVNCSPLIYPPSKNIDVFKIACGNYHVVIAASVGVFGWGQNGSGQLAGFPSKNNIAGIKQVYPKQIKYGTVQLSCGNEHTAILIKNQPLVMFGQSQGGIISGNGHKFDNVSCGGLHSLGLRDGNVYSWGRGEGGQLGHKTSVLKTKVKQESTDFFLDYPKKIENIPKIKKSVCGDAHSILLSEDGEVYVFGFAYQGQLGLGLTGDSDVFQVFEPVKLQLQNKDLKIVDIFAGSTASFFKTSSGQIFSCGLNDCNQLGKQKTMKVFQKKKYIGKPQNQKHSKPGEEQFSRPGKIQIFNKQMKVNKISCGQNHCLASVQYLKKNKMIMGWGLNKQFQISCEFPADSITPRTVGNVYDYNFDDICCGSIFSLGVVLNEGRMGIKELQDKIGKALEKSFPISKL